MDEEESKKPRLNFVRDGNFYIYGDIDESIPENIIAPFIDVLHSQMKLAPNERSSIIFNICSEGGYYNYAMDLVNLFRVAIKSGIEIQTTVFSFAGSAASMIAVSGSKRFATPDAVHLVHFVRSWNFSHNPEMSKRNQQYEDFINKQIVKLYEEKTKLKNVSSKLTADNYMVCGAKELLKQGFIDYIL